MTWHAKILVNEKCTAAFTLTAVTFTSNPILAPTPTLTLAVTVGVYANATTNPNLTTLVFALTITVLVIAIPIITIPIRKLGLQNFLTKAWSWWR